MERQRHGFEFEKYCEQEYGVKLNEGYTDKWDGVFRNKPVSIKYEKLGSDIELGDMVRQSEVDEDFYMIVGFHEDGKLVEKHLLYVFHKDWNELFDHKTVIGFRDMLAYFSNDPSDDAKWKYAIARCKKLWEVRTPFLIRPRFKRDHKNQKRIQCAINNKDFYRYFLPHYEVKGYT